MERRIIHAIRAQQTSSVFRKKNDNQYGASSLQAGRTGDWIDAAADTPQTAELQGGAAPSHSWLLTTVSPTTPAISRGTLTRVSLASTQPQGLPKGARTCSAVAGERQSRKGMEWLCPAASPWGKATPGTQFSLCVVLSPFLLVLYTPWWLFCEPLLLPSPQPCAHSFLKHL